MSTLRAMSFNPTPYAARLLDNKFLSELDGFELLGGHYTAPNGSEWAIYLDGEFPIQSDSRYLCSFQSFKSGYRAVVVRPFRGTSRG